MTVNYQLSAILAETPWKNKATLLLVLAWRSTLHKYICLPLIGQ